MGSNLVRTWRMRSPILIQAHIVCIDLVVRVQDWNSFHLNLPVILLPGKARRKILSSAWCRCKPRSAERPPMEHIHARVLCTPSSPVRSCNPKHLPCKRNVHSFKVIPFGLHVLVLKLDWNAFQLNHFFYHSINPLRDNGYIRLHDFLIWFTGKRP